MDSIILTLTVLYGIPQMLWRRPGMKFWRKKRLTSGWRRISWRGFSEDCFRILRKRFFPIRQRLSSFESLTFAAMQSMNFWEKKGRRFMKGLKIPWGNWVSAIPLFVVSNCPAGYIELVFEKQGLESISQDISARGIQARLRLPISRQLRKNMSWRHLSMWVIPSGITRPVRRRKCHLYLPLMALGRWIHRIMWLRSRWICWHYSDFSRIMSACNFFAKGYF